MVLLIWKEIRSKTYFVENTRKNYKQNTPIRILLYISIIFLCVFPFILHSIYRASYYIWNSKKGYIHSRNPIRINHTEVVYLDKYWPHFMGCGNKAFKDDEKSVYMCFVVIIVTEALAYCLYDQSTHKYDRIESVLDNCIVFYVKYFQYTTYTKMIHSFPNSFW